MKSSSYAGRSTGAAEKADRGSARCFEGFGNYGLKAQAFGEACEEVLAGEGDQRPENLCERSGPNRVEYGEGSTRNDSRAGDTRSGVASVRMQIATSRG